MEKQLVVGIGDMKLGRQEGTIITYALGSCIGIALYDPMIKLGALVHIMLPERVNSDANIFKYADTGVRETLRKLYAYGAVKHRLTAKIAGGAKMFDMKGKSSAMGNIGERNAQMVKRVLMQEGIRIVKEDTGANYARTMSIDLASGMVLVKTFGRPELRM
ncbi:MAG: chemotaxis protein CheD [Lachnospiraceae bacterium]|uniref:chemotaxis protein CheD n=1 Tax=Candidatus Merdisoma sp. JLR.KK011 TaxID=3114299 RepID=UPI0014352961|nr:chemotaxis protein CheD [Lachnospiraceae bacterium]MCI9622783.1 chemotaxis protein CheD [Lachnospiraceae bacterium]GFI08161.1 chemoreceptor glutamine deamidase CheD [Lachnospiraceae bacterium]